MARKSARYDVLCQNIEQQNQFSAFMTTFVERRALNFLRFVHPGAKFVFKNFEENPEDVEEAQNHNQISLSVIE